MCMCPRFYTVRVAGSTVSVRASCFASPEVQESLQLAMATAGVPSFVNYVVQVCVCVYVCLYMWMV